MVYSQGAGQEYDGVAYETAPSEAELTIFKGYRMQIDPDKRKTGEQWPSSLRRGRVLR